MLQNVISGKYLLGTLIVPKKYTKYEVDKQGKISESEYTVSGRKIELEIIRKKMFEEHESLGIIRPTENNVLTRHLIVWADHASVLNSGHLLITVKCVYTPSLS